MKQIKYILLALVFAVFLNACNTNKQKATDTDFLGLENRYLGQNPPGLTPEVFAPGIVSTAHHEWGPFFTPDMKKFYFSRRNNKTGMARVRIETRTEWGDLSRW